MASSDAQQRPRRFAKKACDACHKSKIKCVPAQDEDTVECYDCKRRGLECTRTKVERTLRRRGRGPRQLQRTSETNSGHRSELPMMEPERPLSTPIGEAPLPEPAGAAEAIPDQSLDLTEYYFDRVNHVFPIVNKELLLKDLFNRALQPSSASNEAHDIGTDFSQIAKAGSIALAGHLSGLAESTDDSAARSASERNRAFLESTKASIGGLVVATPSISSVQALLMLCVNMTIAPTQLEPAAALLAVAIRHAHSLRLHVLNQVQGLIPLERLAQIRLFWCLYILDKDLSLRMQSPPLIDDRDLFVLEPREVSDDRLGLVTALDGVLALNLFTARQRLARVQSQIWTRICSFAAQHAPDSERAASRAEVNAGLVAWRERWFAGGRTVIREDLWPKWASLFIARLHFAYFSSLLVAVPSESSTDVVLPPCEVLEAARITFVAGRLVCHGGAAWLAECLDVHASAALVLLQAITARSDKPSAYRDFMTVEVWLQVAEQINPGR
ncbi:hypothetical protein B0A48_06395 [Cryoendolithus antarcticus]|uniref:Zn(2)-C6 fungal-type domain-containing protein n=1 Tax=Cryoendolithus antarcticus TaxID=1507870 RepID=A0A1V8TAX1_9PEZI|nr:hypothetical protein B0A48_06395 [Cryoendolithus antarcticus]